MNPHQPFADSLINSCNIILGAGHFHELLILGNLIDRIIASKGKLYTFCSPSFLARKRRFFDNVFNARCTSN